MNTGTGSGRSTRCSGALECGRDASKPALLFADVADNPGGGGRGNTVYILEAFHRAGMLQPYVFDTAPGVRCERVG